MSARDRILGRVRAAVLARTPTPHPGDFAGWRPGEPTTSSIDAFISLFEAAGGEVVRASDTRDAARRLAEIAAPFSTAHCGRGVPPPLRPRLPEAPPDTAELGVSVARGAVAETGSLIMDARDGRRSQLLVPNHIVLVWTADVFRTLRAALAMLRADLPSAIGLHSGPSKSADIGQIMVRGVHGPGRVVALLVDQAPPGTDALD